MSFQTTKNIPNIEVFFISFYSLEISLKIIAFGFYQFFKDPWNSMDLIIVALSLLPIIISSNKSVSLAIFRLIKILKPLRTINSIKSLKIILIAFFDAIPLLFDTIIILLFFFYIFSIIGLNFFSGMLKKRCFHEKSGVSIEQYILTQEIKLCGNYNCKEGFICGKLLDNPNFGITNFDNIFSSFFQVFQCITLEGWTQMMQYIFESFSLLSFFYFCLLIIFGSFFLMNIVLAVLKVKFSESKINCASNKLNSNTKNQKKELIHKENNNEKTFMLREYKDACKLENFLHSGMLLSELLKEKKRINSFSMKKKIFFENISKKHKIPQEDLEFKENKQKIIPKSKFNYNHSLSNTPKSPKMSNISNNLFNKSKSIFGFKGKNSQRKLEKQKTTVVVKQNIVRISNLFPNKEKDRVSIKKFFDDIPINECKIELIPSQYISSSGNNILLILLHCFYYY